MEGEDPFDDLETPWEAREPTSEDFNVLERIGERRADVEALVPTDRHEEILRGHLLAVLDAMEETLCLYGHQAPEVAEGWRRIAPFESFVKKAGSRPSDQRSQEDSQPRRRR